MAAHCVQVPKIVDNGDGTGTITMPSGAVIDFCTDCATGGGADTFATFVENGDGSVTFTSADGNTTTTIGPDTDTFVSFTTNPDGSITLTSADGTTTAVIPPGSTGGTDTFVTFTETQDGTITFTSADGNTTAVVAKNCPAFSTDRYFCEPDDYIAPVKVFCDGTTSDGVLLVNTAPVGGDETYEMFINGAPAGQFVLPAGSTSVPIPPVTLATGEYLTFQLINSTATVPSTLGTFTYWTECDC